LLVGPVFLQPLPRDEVPLLLLLPLRRHRIQQPLLLLARLDS